MSDKPVKKEPGKYAELELAQMSESVRSLENAIWVAAGAFLAILGFGLNWMYQSADDRSLSLGVFAALLVLQVIAILVARTWVNGSVRMMERLVELTEELDMQPDVPRALIVARRRAETFGTLFMVAGILATIGLFAASQHRADEAARRTKPEPTLVRIVRDSVVPVTPAPDGKR